MRQCSSTHLFTLQIYPRINALDIATVSTSTRIVMLLSIARRTCAVAVRRTTSLRTITRIQPVAAFHSRTAIFSDATSSTVAGVIAPEPKPAPRRPRPSTRFTPRRYTDPSFFETPKPPTIESKEQMLALEHKVRNEGS